jgi:hypothetical protein
MPNSGFFWTEAAISDLLALSREDFLAKYEKVSGHAYRQRLAEERRKVEFATPIAVTDDGLYRPQEWNYQPRSPIVPYGLEKHVNIGDTHGVFVDQRTWAAVLDFVRDFKPDQINLLGDIADFYDISRFDKNPNRRIVLGKEIEFTRDVILAELRRAAPKSRIIWVEGNHENRLQRYLWSRAPELASLPGMDMRELFRLRDLKITYTQQSLEVGDIQMTHGHMARKHSGWTAKAMMDEYGTSVIHNHTHRLGAIYKTDRGGEYVAFENGCLCNLNPEYINGVPNWQHGFSVGWVLPHGRFHFEQITILDGRFVYGGKFFGADDPVTDCHD